MSNTTMIYLTDPLQGSIPIRDYTTNSTIHPLSSLLTTTSAGANSCLYLGGKGVVQYGERIFENLIQMLEHHASASEPKYPIAGQLWYCKGTYLRTNSGFFKWDNSSQTWNAFNETVAPYYFDGVYLKYTEPNTNHPLYNVQIICTFTTDLTITTPSVSVRPNNILKIFDGTNWNVLTAVSVSNTAPLTPYIGQQWFDQPNHKLRIYTGSSWETTASDYVPLIGGSINGNLSVNGTFTLNGDLQITGTHDLDFGGNRLQNISEPASPSDAATMNYVDNAIPTYSLDDITDVVITGLADNDVLSYDTFSTKWINRSIQLSDFGVTSSPAELNYTTGVTSSIQNQLDDKFSISTGGTVLGSGVTFDFNGNRLQDIGEPTNPSDAVTKNYAEDYVDTEISTLSSSIATLYYPLTGGTLSGNLNAIGSISSGNVSVFDADVGGAVLKHTTASGNALTIQSTQVSATHPFTSYVDSSTYFAVAKASSGATVRGFGPSSTGLSITGFATTPTSGNAVSDHGVVKINSYTTDGSSGVSTVADGSNILTIENNNSSKVFVKGDGSIFAGNTTGISYDSTYNAASFTQVIINKHADFSGIRKKTVTLPSAGTPDVDSILTSDFRKLVIYNTTNNGWGFVRLPDVTTIDDNYSHMPITIMNGTSINSGYIHVVPGGSGDVISNADSNAFFPDGVVTLGRGATVSLLPSPLDGSWLVIDYNRPAVTNNAASMALTLSASISGSGSITVRRGFLGMQVTKTGTGTYKLDWQVEAVFGTGPQIYVQINDPATSGSFTSTVDVTGATTAIVRTYANGTLDDKAFFVLFSYPTGNTYQP